MRRSIGPGMGSGGGMIKTVQRAMRGGIGGGASPAEAPPYSHFTTRSTTSNNHQQPINTALCLSSNNLHHPAPAALPPKWASLTTSECEEYDWECIDDDGESSCDVNIGVSNDDYVFGSVPSKDEVHHAVSSLQEVVDEYYGMIDKEKTSCYFEKSGWDESDWREPTSLDLICNSRSRVYDAFHLMQTDPSVQRMVISLSSDKAVWDAVMKNDQVVRELQESISEEKSIWEEDDHVVNVDIGGNPVKQLLRWMFVNTKDKVVEIVDRITKIVNDLLVQPTNPKRDHDQAAGTTASTSTSPAAAADSSSFQEKLKSSFLLSIMVLLIVVVNRATRKA